MITSTKLCSSIASCRGQMPAMLHLLAEVILQPSQALRKTRSSSTTSRRIPRCGIHPQHRWQMALTSVAFEPLARQAALLIRGSGSQVKRGITRHGRQANRTTTQTICRALRLGVCRVQPRLGLTTLRRTLFHEHSSSSIQSPLLPLLHSYCCAESCHDAACVECVSLSPSEITNVQ